MENYHKKSDLELMVGQNEKIFYKGKPDKLCFTLESIFNPMLPFAIIWGLIDFSVIGGVFVSGEAQAPELKFLLIPFLLLHLMPVWIYIGGIIFTAKKYQNTEYIITDKGVYVSGGIFTYNYEMKPFTDLAHINIHRGIFDQMLGVGDVIMICGHSGCNSHNNHPAGGLTICDIRNYRWVFKLLKDLQTDIYADTMYPNDLRPRENHGYNTNYRKGYNN